MVSILKGHLLKQNKNQKQKKNKRQQFDYTDMPRVRLW